MANFDWRDAERQRDIFRRYPPDALGLDYWMTLLGNLFELRQSWETEHGEERIRALFSDFLNATRGIAPLTRVCRVFVSHQRADVIYAETIAYFAYKQGFEYWLDVHDPVLPVVNAATLPASVKAVLIAAIIEMALLNCSHVCSVQTQNAKQSRWVPYEFGRAKERRLQSSKAASWFDNGVAPTTAEYLLLGQCLVSTGEVKSWLSSEWSPDGCRDSKPLWPPHRPAPNPLPN